MTTPDHPAAPESGQRAEVSERALNERMQAYAAREAEHDRIMRDLRDAIIYQESLGNPYGPHAAFDEATRRVAALRETPAAAQGTSTRERTEWDESRNVRALVRTLEVLTSDPEAPAYAVSHLRDAIDCIVSLAAEQSGERPQEARERAAVVDFAEAWANKWERIVAASSNEDEYNRAYATALEMCAHMLRENALKLQEEAAPPVESEPRPERKGWWGKCPACGSLLGGLSEDERAQVFAAIEPTRAEGETLAARLRDAAKFLVACRGTEPWEFYEEHAATCREAAALVERAPREEAQT